MNKQQIFNKVWNHFIVEDNGPSILSNEDGRARCSYRSPDGNKCAAGVIISDDDYDPEMEGIRVMQLVEKFNVPDYMTKHAYFIDLLQQSHDNIAQGPLEEFRDKMKKNMIYVANTYELTVPDAE